MASFYALSPINRSRSVTPMSYTPDFSSKHLPHIGAGPNAPSKHVASLGKCANTRNSESYGNARTYYNPATQGLQNRFAPNDWFNSNNSHYSLSDRERSTASNIRSDAFRVIKEMDQRTRNRQAECSKKLAERVQDIAMWKAELNNEINAMENERANMAEYKRVLEKAYSDTANPLHVAEECLMHREKRMGIDLVHDNVEKALTKEVEKIRSCQSKMKKMLEKAHIQQKLNRAAMHECEKDAKDKNHAQGLDDRMQQLRNSSAAIGYFPGIENVDNTISVPETWARFSYQNIERSQRERSASEKLRGDIDSLLRACANELWTNFNATNSAFAARVAETTDARNKLQNHLSRVMQEIFDMEKNVELLRKAVADKEAPLKVAMTRLEERTRRLNVELCNDPSMKGLQREVEEIKQAIAFLKDKLRTSEQSLSRLHKTKNTIQHDICVKENSLQIDGRHCLGMRKGFPMDPKVGPIMSMPGPVLTMPYDY